MSDIANARYMNPNEPVDARVDDLIAQMTLEEKASQMIYTAKAIDRLRIPEYNWWNECLHGVARNGKATVFPQAIGLGAAFDRDLALRVATAISDEGRAKHHAAAKRGERRQYQGLTFWTPNINIFRDPRWGRGQETYGEDPYLTGEIGVAFVKGLQGDDPMYMKTAACAKHYAVHSGPERLRHEFDAVVSEKDLRETYLPAFKRLVDAGVESVMGAYNRTNHEPCCGSKRLLVDILRGEWKFQGHVVSDCWAVRDFHEHHKVTSRPEESVRLAVKMGCDLNCGCTYERLLNAVEEGLLEERDLDACLRPLFRTRFKLGMFDPEERVKYASIPTSVVCSDEHRAIAHEAAVKSIVLAKNKGGILPLSKEIPSLFVTGPNAFSNEVVLGNYFGVTDKVSSVLEGIVGNVDESTNIEYKIGCLAAHENTNPNDWVTGSPKYVDATIAVMGIDGTMEGEEGDAIVSDDAGDRTDVLLPAHQRDFLKKLCSHEGRPVIVVLLCGGPVSIPEVHELADAVVYAWYPGEQGGMAVADVLFGKETPSGKFPVTVVKGVEDLPPYDDYSMDGRTYRFLEKTPLYPFGFGLSYTTFAYSDIHLSASTIKKGERVTVSATVTNTGERAGDEIVQVYVTDVEASVRVPKAELKEFARVTLGKGESKNISFTLPPDAFMLVQEDGTFVVEEGEFVITVGGCSPSARGLELGAPQPQTASLTITG